MISILYGPGGTGKSYFQVRLVIHELRTSKRNIVTNLSLNIARLNEYLEEAFPDESIDVVGRVRILTVSETKEFWKHRGPIRWAPGTDYDLEADPGANGVAFIIDEAGAAGFSAQEWAATVGRATRGVECSWYLDQQRKFGDNVYASTNGRTPNQIAKGFRDKAHEFIRLKNGYLQTYGIFKARGRFQALHYAGEPGPSSEPFREEVWHMDTKGVASCYRTQDGVGVMGSTADIGARAKGIPILVVLPAAMVLGLGCIALPWMLGKGASHVATRKAAPAAPSAVSTAAASLGLPIGQPAKPAGGTSAAAVGSPVTGVSMHGGFLNVAVRDRGWLRVTGATPDGRVVLEDGTIVLRSDVMRGGSPPAVAATP